MEYDFTWVREEAKHLQHGIIDLQLKVHRGEIVLVTIVDSKKQISLSVQEAERKKDEVIE